jgi:hypothetical protein
MQVAQAGSTASSGVPPIAPATTADIDRGKAALASRDRLAELRQGNATSELSRANAFQLDPKHAEVSAELDRRDAERAKRSAAERSARLQREAAEAAEETARLESVAHERVRQLQEPGKMIIQSALDLLLRGDHRRAWQALYSDVPSDDTVEGRLWQRLNADRLPFGEAIGTDPAMASTAVELSRRIDWSREREIAERQREIHGERLRSAGLIDFDQLDRALASNGGAGRRPALVGVIYSITMPDGEVYVGKTARDPEVRWEEHLREADAGDMKPKSLALRYWSAQGRAHDVRWRVEERVMGWGEEDLDCAEKRWMRMGTLNVMDALRAATIYPAS